MVEVCMVGMMYGGDYVCCTSSVTYNHGISGPTPEVPAVEKLLQRMVAETQSRPPPVLSSPAPTELEQMMRSFLAGQRQRNRPPQRQRPARRDWSDVVCFSCGKSGHAATRCPNLNDSFPFMQSGWRAEKTPTLWGHSGRECPRAEQNRQRPSDVSELHGGPGSPCMGEILISPEVTGNVLPVVLAGGSPLAVAVNPAGPDGPVVAGGSVGPCETPSPRSCGALEPLEHSVLIHADPAGQHAAVGTLSPSDCYPAGPADPSVAGGPVGPDVSFKVLEPLEHSEARPMEGITETDPPERSVLASQLDYGQSKLESPAWPMLNVIQDDITDTDTDPSECSALATRLEYGRHAA